MGYSVSTPVGSQKMTVHTGRIVLGLICATLALGLTAGVARGDTQLQQGTPIAWDGYHSDCSGGEALVLDPGQVLWYFKLSGAQSDEGNLTATFAQLGQRATVGAMVNGTLHFMFVTNIPETLLGAQTGVDGERLDLSHVCAMQIAEPKPDPSQSPAPTATPAPEKTPKPTPKPTPKATPKPTPKPTATPKPTPQPTATSKPAPDPTTRPTRAPQPTDSPPPIEQEVPTPAATLDPTPSAAPTEGVLSPSPAATTEPTESPTPLLTAAPITAPAPSVTALAEPSDTPVPALFVPTSNEPPPSNGLDPLYIVVGAGLLVGLLTLLIALRGSLRRGPSARVLG